MTYVFIGVTLEEAKAAALAYLEDNPAFTKIRLYTRETTGGGALHVAEITIEERKYDL